MLLKVLILFSLLFNTLNAYESEEKLKIIVIGKIAKFIKWEPSKNKVFTITILNNPDDTLFDEIFLNKKIQGKNVKLIYIDNIDQLSITNILYIPKTDSKALLNILKKTKNKNILTVSDIRGFADKNGIIQISFVSQKVKLKINLNEANKSRLKISLSLLRIADVIKDNHS